MVKVLEAGEIRDFAGRRTCIEMLCCCFPSEVVRFVVHLAGDRGPSTSGGRTQFVPQPSDSVGNERRNARVPGVRWVVNAC